jgi:hypothetical protein
MSNILTIRSHGMRRIKRLLRNNPHSASPEFGGGGGSRRLTEGVRTGLFSHREHTQTLAHKAINHQKLS